MYLVKVQTAQLPKLLRLNLFRRCNVINSQSLWNPLRFLGKWRYCLTFISKSAWSLLAAKEAVKISKASSHSLWDQDEEEEEVGVDFPTTLEDFNRKWLHMSTLWRWVALLAHNVQQRWWLWNGPKGRACRLENGTPYYFVGRNKSLLLELSTIHHPLVCFLFILGRRLP